MRSRARAAICADIENVRAASRDAAGSRRTDLARARRLTLIAGLVALLTAIVWLALESASMADDWSGAVAPDLIGAVLTDTARPQPERQA